MVFRAAGILTTCITLAAVVAGAGSGEEGEVGAVPWPRGLDAVPEVENRSVLCIFPRCHCCLTLSDLACYASTRSDPGHGSAGPGRGADGAGGPPEDGLDNAEELAGPALAPLGAVQCVPHGPATAPGW